VDEANQCRKPTAASRFAPTDERVWLWFDVTGAAVGDRARDEWYDPDGNLYRSANWDPLPAGGYRCFWDSIFLANSQAAAKPGRWTIRVYYNDTLFFSLSFTLNVANLQEQIVARSLDEANQCKAPTPVSALLTTDQRVWVWFFVNGALPGDTARIEWYEPNGNLYTTYNWEPITFTNEVCFWTWLGIANQPLAAKTGAWRVRVFYNNAPFFTASFTIMPPSYGGAVVIDGTDANEHGHVSGGKNQEGWLYMQRVLESLAARVPLNAAKIVADLGTDENTGARAAIDSAFNLSSLPSAGWRLVHVNGSDNVNLWLTNLGIANTGILYVPTYSHVAGDLSVGEMAAVNARATNIARFFTGNGDASRGGAVFAMSESNTDTRQGAWQWLQALFPGIGVINYGTGGVATDIKLTPDGGNTLAGLTNDDLVDVHPWHNSFFQLQGRLKVLGVAPDSDGVSRQVILGGEARDLIVKPCILTCAAQAPTEAVAGVPAGTFTAAHTLSDCTGAPLIAWDFGNGQRSSSAAARPTYTTPGVYNWTLTVNAANASTCTRTGQVTVRENCAAPAIISHPHSTVSARGRTATLSVIASGSPPLRYQWYAGGRGDTSSPISGATLSTFTTPALNASASFWVRVSNTCGVRDVPTADSGEALVTVTDPLALNVEAVDPACNSQTDCTGEYLQEVSANEVLPNRNRLTEIKVHRAGIAADGVTLLLLRVRSDLPVTFSIVGGTQRGTLLRLNGTLGGANGSEVTVTPELIGTSRMALALFRAPLNYDAIQLAINAVSSQGNGRLQLKLYRPPVVLVHGVWSGGGAWEGLEQHLRPLGFEVIERVDYGSLVGQSAGSFDPLATAEMDQVVIGALATSTQRALDALRDKNVAVSQVDVVGHSMGGLVARGRVRANFPEPYKRKLNYGQGDFHKIITVGSPHQGSPLADWLAEHKCHQFGFITTFDAFFNNNRLKRPIGPAIFGFQTGGQALKNLGETRVPAHAIVGIAPENSDTEDNLNLVRQLSFVPSLTLDEMLDLDPSDGRANGPHDTIVPVSSQRGGLPSGAITEKPWDIVHADIEFETLKEKYNPNDPDDTGETASQRVWERVTELLRASISSSTFAFFPAWQPSSQAPNRSYQVCPQNFQASVVGEAATGTITPAPGTIVRPGQSVQVSYSLSSGTQVDGALFAINGKFARIDGNGPFSFSFIAPANVAGRIEIGAFTFGNPNGIDLASTHIVVQPATALLTLSVTPDNLRFTRVGERMQLRVFGAFADGTQMDLTESASGTTYATRSGANNILVASSEGVVQTRGLGQETLLVSHGGKTATVNVSVSPGAPPETKLASVSAASFLGDALAPESIVAAFGINLAASVVAASSTPLPTRLGGVSVTVRDSVGAERLAPIFFVSPGQINFQIPPGTATGAASTTVNKEQGFPAVSSALIESVAPAFFSANASGQGVAAAVALRVRADGTQSYEPVAQFDATRQQFVPAPLDLGPPTDQVFLILFGTGIRYHSGLTSMLAKIGGVDAEVLYAGPQGGFVGLDQVNLRLPRSLAGRGEVDLTLAVDGRAANTVRVSFR
jgi:uncharacterized protein (TIGR03437 family)